MQMYENKGLRYLRAPVYFLARFSFFLFFVSLSRLCVCVCVCARAKTGKTHVTNSYKHIIKLKI